MFTMEKEYCSVHPAEELHLGYCSQCIKAWNRFHAELKGASQAKLHELEQQGLI